MGRSEYRQSLKKSSKRRAHGGAQDEQDKTDSLESKGASAPDGAPPKKKARRKGAVALVAILLIAAGAASLWFFWPRPKSQYELDREALEGFLPGRSQQEIEDELNRIIDKGRFNVAINPTPVVANGKINIMIENVPANNYYMQVDVFFTTADGPKKIYSSGIIKQGYFIEEAAADVTLAPGEYDGYAVFRALQPETLEEIGMTQATLVGKVE